MPAAKTKSGSAVVEIQIDHKNRNVSFPPLDRKVRGTFDINREREPNAVHLRDRIPLIPGQMIGLDPDAGVGWIADPIVESETIVDFVRKRGEKVPAAREEFENVDVAEWSHWIGRLVAAGRAKVVTGKAPETSPTYVPRHVAEPPTKDARRNRVLRRDPKLAWEYVNAPADKRDEFEQVMGLA